MVRALRKNATRVPVNCAPMKYVADKLDPGSINQRTVKFVTEQHIM